MKGTGLLQGTGGKWTMFHVTQVLKGTLDYYKALAASGPCST